ncbi:hypothetical protein [Curtobacterium flaccumfaciens]
MDGGPLVHIERTWMSVRIGRSTVDRVQIGTAEDAAGGTIGK